MAQPKQTKAIAALIALLLLGALALLMMTREEVALLTPRDSEDRAAASLAEDPPPEAEPSKTSSRVDEKEAVQTAPKEGGAEIEPKPEASQEEPRRFVRATIRPLLDGRLEPRLYAFIEEVEYYHDLDEGDSGPYLYRSASALYRSGYADEVSADERGELHISTWFETMRVPALAASYASEGDLDFGTIDVEFRDLMGAEYAFASASLMHQSGKDLLLADEESISLQVDYSALGIEKRRSAEIRPHANEKALFILRLCPDSREEDPLEDHEIRELVLRSEFGGELRFVNLTNGIYDFGSTVIGGHLVSLIYQCHLTPPLRWLKEGEKNDEAHIIDHSGHTLKLKYRSGSRKGTVELPYQGEGRYQATWLLAAGDYRLEMPDLSISYLSEDSMRIEAFQAKDGGFSELLWEYKAPVFSIVKVKAKSGVELSNFCIESAEGDHKVFRESLAKIRRFRQFQERGLVGYLRETGLVLMNQEVPLVAAASEKFRPHFLVLDKGPAIYEILLSEPWPPMSAEEIAASSTELKITINLNGKSIRKGTELSLEIENIFSSKTIHKTLRFDGEQFTPTIFKNIHKELAGEWSDPLEVSCLPVLKLVDREGRAGFDAHKVSTEGAIEMKAGTNAIELTLISDQVFPKAAHEHFTLFAKVGGAPFEHDWPEIARGGSVFESSDIGDLEEEGSGPVLRRTSAESFTLEYEASDFVHIPEAYFNGGKTLYLRFPAGNIEVSKGGDYPVFLKDRHDASDVELLENTNMKSDPIAVAKRISKGKRSFGPPRAKIEFSREGDDNYSWFAHNLDSGEEEEIRGRFTLLAPGRYVWIARMHTIELTRSEPFVVSRGTGPTHVILPAVKGHPPIGLLRMKLTPMLKEKILRGKVEARIGGRLTGVAPMSEQDQQARGRRFKVTLDNNELRVFEVPLDLDLRLTIYIEDLDPEEVALPIAFKIPLPRGFSDPKEDEEVVLDIEEPSFFQVHQSTEFPPTHRKGYGQRRKKLMLATSVAFYCDGEVLPRGIGLYHNKEHDLRVWRKGEEAGAPLAVFTLKPDEEGEPTFDEKAWDQMEELMKTLGIE